MTRNEFEKHVVPSIVAHLREMPSIWFTENDAPDAWEMLVAIWPNGEPGLGFWDEIQSVLRGWIAIHLEKAIPEGLSRAAVREYWEGATRNGSDFDDARFQAEEDGSEEPAYPPNEEICRDIAVVLLGEVLREAESEGIRRECE